MGGTSKQMDSRSAAAATRRLSCWRGAFASVPRIGHCAAALGIRSHLPLPFPLSSCCRVCQDPELPCVGTSEESGNWYSSAVPMRVHRGNMGSCDPTTRADRCAYGAVYSTHAELPMRTGSLTHALVRCSPKVRRPLDDATLMGTCDRRRTRARTCL